MAYIKFETILEFKNLVTEKFQDYEEFINFHEDIDERERSNEVLQYNESNEEKLDNRVFKNLGKEDKNPGAGDNDEAFNKLEYGDIDIEAFAKPDHKEIKDEIQQQPADEVETDLDNPEEYDSYGCPVVPFAFSGMTGRLGNVMSTYINFIALQWKLGYKYFLPKYMNHHSWADLTKPYFESIFENVTFPVATWSNITVARDASDNDVILFNNSRTNYEEKTCDKEYMRVNNVEPFFSDFLECAENHQCEGKSCLACSGACACTNIWVTIATGANYPDFKFIGNVLDDIIKYHLQFTEKVNNNAKAVIKSVALAMDSLEDMVYVGVHVRYVRQQFLEPEVFIIHFIQENRL